MAWHHVGGILSFGCVWGCEGVGSQNIRYFHTFKLCFGPLQTRSTLQAAGWIKQRITYINIGVVGDVLLITPLSQRYKDNTHKYRRFHSADRGCTSRSRRPSEHLGLWTHNLSSNHDLTIALYILLILCVCFLLLIYYFNLLYANVYMWSTLSLPCVWRVLHK